jgi:hypothetical protein
MAGLTTSNPSGPVALQGDAITKGATVPEIIFNDTNGPKPFINTVQGSLFARPDANATQISYSFNTDGEQGGGIDWAEVFQVEILHQGDVIYTTSPFRFQGPCRGGHYHPNAGQEQAPLDIFAAADAINIPAMTVNVYPC